MSFGNTNNNAPTYRSSLSNQAYNPALGMTIQRYGNAPNYNNNNINNNSNTATTTQPQQQSVDNNAAVYNSNNNNTTKYDVYNNNNNTNTNNTTPTSRANFITQQQQQSNNYNSSPNVTVDTNSNTTPYVQAPVTPPKPAIDIRRLSGQL